MYQFLYQSDPVAASDEWPYLLQSPGECTPSPAGAHPFVIKAALRLPPIVRAPFAVSQELTFAHGSAPIGVGVDNGLAGFGRLRRESCLSPGQRACAATHRHSGHPVYAGQHSKADTG